MIKQYLRLPNERHAIKEASISLFFGSPFVHANALAQLINENFSNEFNRVEKVQGLELELELPKMLSNADMSASTKRLGLPGVYAAFTESGTQVRVLQIRNEPERTVLSFHDLQYKRWADFIALFFQIVEKVAPLLNNLIVLAAGLHYQDEMEWTHPSEPLDLVSLYQPTSDYLPAHFFDGRFSELLLTVPGGTSELQFFDRLHITSVTDGRPIATISHNVIHQFVNPDDLVSLLGQPNTLESVLQQAHKHNKTVLSGILQPEIQRIIGLTV